MKDATPFVPSKKAANIFVAIYAIAFLLGLLGVFLLPQEEAMLKKVAFVMSYFFGLPLVVSAGLLALRKAGFWNGK
jgi:hypothetical protein